MLPGEKLGLYRLLDVVVALTDGHVEADPQSEILGRHQGYRGLHTDRRPQEMLHHLAGVAEGHGFPADGVGEDDGVVEEPVKGLPPQRDLGGELQPAQDRQGCSP